MKPPVFDYLAPGTIDEALRLLGELGDGAKVLAGGQSLVPLLNFRLVRPQHLVDLNGLTDLAGITRENGYLVIGAMTRQRTVERSALVRETCPLLAEAMPQIGHTQIRNRGTVGGSLAHSDPAAEIPAVVAALGGEVVVRNRRGTRSIASDQFFTGYLATALEPDELLVSVRLPVVPARTGHAFMELSRRHGDFALVGVAAVITLDASGRASHAALALTGVGPTPVVAREAVRVLIGEAPTPAAFEEVGRRVSAVLEPDSDLHASAEYRKHLGGVLTRRALARAAERATSGGEPAAKEQR